MKKVLMKNLKFLLFPIYIPVTLIKSKLQFDPMNPTNSDILKFLKESAYKNSKFVLHSLGL